MFAFKGCWCEAGGAARSGAVYYYEVDVAEYRGRGVAGHEGAEHGLQVGTLRKIVGWHGGLHGFWGLGLEG